MSVVHSRLLYGAQVWADRVQEVAKAKESLSMAQRTAALRVARCYRTVSDVAAQVLARMPPAFILALERKRIGEARKMGVHLSKSDARAETIRQWQVHWDSTLKGSWTKRLIPDLHRWWHYGPRQLSFNMTQDLTNHGCFQKYLHSKQRAQQPSCVHCDADEDDAEHTIFDCSFWEAERAELVRVTGRQPRPSDVQDLLCGPRPADLPTEGKLKSTILEKALSMSRTFTIMVEDIMEKKQVLEREMQRMANQN